MCVCVCRARARTHIHTHAHTQACTHGVRMCIVCCEYSTYTFCISACIFYIVSALYGDSVGPGGFHYISYIYLITPIQHGLINPIGYFCMEYALQKSTHNNPQSSVSWKALLYKTLWNLMINPIFNMTVLGIAINLIMSKVIHGDDNNYDPDDNLKKWMKQFLTLLGNAYYASALIYLGISMYGKLNRLTVVLVLKLLLLCFVKLLVTHNTLVEYYQLFHYRILTPLVWQLVLEALGLGKQITTYGFILGTLPASPSVFVYATLFRCGIDLVSIRTGTDNNFAILIQYILECTHCFMKDNLPN